MKMNPQLAEDWKKLFMPEFQKPYMAELKKFLRTEKQKGFIYYPRPNQVFNAFNLCPFRLLKVVIIGQDPYHGEGQAHGLCFSVPSGVKQPPSLKNIFKELNHDLGVPVPATGDLSSWARQGVLLLNASLTVRAHSPGSHFKQGWETFTDEVIKTINEKTEGVVFLLWGRFAKNKGVHIDKSKHFILEAAHPSPLSAHNGFLGCRHFSRTNELLKSVNKKPIDWRLS